ncbi:MAG: hypothetical protein V3S36_01230 [Acidiferrobacterales bacterium]
MATLRDSLPGGVQAIEGGAVRSLPRASFPSGIELQAGLVIGFEIAGYGEVGGWWSRCRLLQYGWTSPIRWPGMT